MSEKIQSASAEREDIKAMQKLLGKAREIYKRNDEIRAEKRRSGKLFNVFNVLGLWSEEVRLHSAFLKELLDPKGSHGCADKFLVAFCKQTGVKFDCNDACVEKEKVFDDGRMDIVITQKDKRKVIVIENKIYAGDQYGQLLRYSAYCKQQLYSEGNWTLLYLTLDGHDPSEESTGDTLESGKDYRTISYKKDILEWLKQCKDKSKCSVNVESSIAQYIDLVEQLANNYMEDEMAKEVTSLLMEGENLALADRMAQWIGNAKFKVWEEKIKPMLKERCKITDFDFGEGFGENQSSFTVRKEKWDEKHLCICFAFDNSQWKNLLCGIAHENGKPSAKVVKNICKQLDGGEKQNQWWALWTWMPDKYRNWDGKTLCRIVAHPDNFCELINKLIKRYTTIIDDALASSAN